jgi:hypothetical protein
MKTLLVVALAFCAGACASRPYPAARVGSAEAAIRAAQESGAPRQPEAAMHLRLASEALGRARAYMAEGDYQRAEWQLLRAEADAQLAVVLAREAERLSALDTQQKAAP